MLVDLNRTERLSAERLSSKGKVSAYEGMEVTAWPVATYVRGKPVMRDGHILVAPGYGREVVQTMPPPQPRNEDTFLSTIAKT